MQPARPPAPPNPTACPVRVPLTDRLGDRITSGRAQWAGQDERQPEQHHRVDAGQVVSGEQEQHDSGDGEEGIAESQASAVGQPVAAGGAEGVGHENRSPVQNLALTRGDLLHVVGLPGTPPHQEDDGQEAGQDDGASSVADPVSGHSPGMADPAVHEVRDCGTNDAGAEDYRPENSRIETLGPQLDTHDDHEEGEEHDRAGDVSKFEFDRKFITAGLSESHSDDLQRPEQRCNQWELPQHILGRACHFRGPGCGDSHDFTCLQMFRFRTHGSDPAHAPMRTA